MYTCMAKITNSLIALIALIALIDSPEFFSNCIFLHCTQFPSLSLNTIEMLCRSSFSVIPGLVKIFKHDRPIGQLIKLQPILILRLLLYAYLYYSTPERGSHFCTFVFICLPNIIYDEGKYYLWWLRDIWQHVEDLLLYLYWCFS